MARPPRRDDSDGESADLEAIFGGTPAAREREDSEPRAIDLAKSAGSETTLLLDPCSRWERPNRAPPALPMWVQTEMPSHLEPEDWGAGFLAVREREIPMELQSDLRNCVPQAFLRDLLRPVQQFHVTPERLEGTETIGRWKAGAAEVKDAQRRDPIPVVVPATEWVREAQGVRKAILDGEWKPHFADDAPRRHPQLYLSPESDDDW